MLFGGLKSNSHWIKMDSTQIAIRRVKRMAAAGTFPYIEPMLQIVVFFDNQFFGIIFKTSYLAVHAKISIREEL